MFENMYLKISPSPLHPRSGDYTCPCHHVSTSHLVSYFRWWFLDSIEGGCKLPNFCTFQHFLLHGYFRNVEPCWLCRNFLISMQKAVWKKNQLVDVEGGFVHLAPLNNTTRIQPEFNSIRMRSLQIGQDEIIFVS